MCMYSNLRHCSKTIKGNNFAYSLRKFVDISLHSITLIRYCLLICNVTNHNSLKSVEMNSNKIKEEDATSENFLIKNYKGLIFDCDGTLVNSMEYYYNGWIPLYQKHELKFSRERFYSLAGVPVRRIIEIVLEENNKTVEANFVDSILEEKKLINSKRRANGEAPTEITCVTNIVKELYGKLPIAVASSGQKFLVQEDLKNHDLLKYFDAVVTVEDVVKGKPAPDIYLEACKRINVGPEHCIGYEDAVLGIESLHAANMDVVNVTEFKRYPD